MIVVSDSEKRKKLLDKVTKGVTTGVAVYVAVSMLSTKVIHDYVFKRYDAENEQEFSAAAEKMVLNKCAYVYPCDDHSLEGVLYTKDDNQCGLIILVPGFNAESVEYESVIYSFLYEGFDVFTFDPTGHGNSEGENSVGFPQIIKDIDATMSFLKGEDNFGYKNIFMFGHSRGGYGVCCTMNSYKDITAVVSVNGVNTSMDAIMAYATKYVGGIAYGNYPFLSLYQSKIFGHELSNSSATEAVNKAKVPVLIVQSENDESIPKDKYSIYSHRDKVSSKNVKFMLYSKENNDGHTSILYDDKGMPNFDIIRQVSEFYKEKSNSKEKSHEKHSNNPSV